MRTTRVIFLDEQPNGECIASGVAVDSLAGEFVDNLRDFFEEIEEGEASDVSAYAVGICGPDNAVAITGMGGNAATIARMLADLILKFSANTSNPKYAIAEITDMALKALRGQQKTTMQTPSGLIIPPAGTEYK